MEKRYRYIEIYKGKQSLEVTDDIEKLISNTYGASSDYYVLNMMCKSHPGIKAIIQKEFYPSIHTNTLIIKINGVVCDVLKNKVLLINLIDNKYESLSIDDIRFIRNEITKKYDGTYVLNHYMEVK